VVVVVMVKRRAHYARELGEKRAGNACWENASQGKEIVSGKLKLLATLSTSLVFFFLISDWPLMRDQSTNSSST